MPFGQKLSLLECSIHSFYPSNGEAFSLILETTPMHTLPRYSWHGVRFGGDFKTLTGSSKRKVRHSHGCR